MSRMWSVWNSTLTATIVDHLCVQGGTTSLSPYLTCNMDAVPTAGLLRTDAASVGLLGGPAVLHVGTARTPLPRFLSAFQEVRIASHRACPFNRAPNACIRFASCPCDHVALCQCTLPCRRV